MYYIYSWNVSFSGVKYLIWLIYKVSSIIGLISYIVDFVTYDITQLEAERLEERRALQREIETIELFRQAFQTTQLSRVVTGLENIANMNLTQMKNHKAKLKSDLEEIEQRLVSLHVFKFNNTCQSSTSRTSRTVNISNSYGATTDLKSETCVLCLENQPVYQFVPCYHCCLCENCVYEQCAKLPSSTDIAADEDDILTAEDYQLTRDIPFDSQFEDSNNFVKCEMSMKPFSSLNQCPLCKTRATKLEYNNMGIKPHVEIRTLNSKYHNDGEKRAKQEVGKLFKYLRRNGSELEKLKKSTKEFLVKTLSVMKK
ncbi:predicted protein [Naegleria gruberi]|uniref:Predicted protein n=1 Tax=Naegleria gruberi TaxID=5762 RepID=D2VLN7_NAEGR|nr:uncharacterized protein NAEGRDRAFT_69846 [Naegleria gruberi]EFC42171.1 predicted protein [Naegleria gruberi]|eukprot:XP_002674915.1 predicted protein [Naegleria gruberi strain NEG-M]